jgi:tetratricopeptide (TPR) repeat protein
MRRREFITLLGGTAAVWPVDGRAQQPPKSTIGFLGSESPDPWAGRLKELHRGLGELGFVEGQNFSIEYRWAQGRNERLPSMAADLVREQVKVIIAPGSTPAALAAQAATKTISIAAWAHLSAERFQEAYESAQRAIDCNPAFADAHGVLAAASAYLGRMGEARSSLGVFTSLIRGSLAEQLSARPFRRPADRETSHEGSR